jgi:hypothetical protein
MYFKAFVFLRSLQVRGVKPVLIERIQDYDKTNKESSCRSGMGGAEDAESPPEAAELPRETVYEPLPRAPNKRIRCEENGNGAEMADRADSGHGDLESEADIAERLNVVFPEPYERLAFFSDDES